jgi:class 3 adenylate cyclase/tetratricopeptide (TPR) repeat protein
MTTATRVSLPRQGEADLSLSRSYLPRLTLEWIARHPSRRHVDVDASMVFVDVSGFTKLSERLAQKGRVGAEELTDLIGSCFTRLLAGAYAEGGSLVKFGGDALLLLFRDDNHPQRAVRAAAAMRRTLAEIGGIDTASGRVRLRMSVGVHTGTFSFFLVGGSHRELIVTGPAATQVVAMESTASAGEIVLSPATAAHLPPGCVGAAAADGFLLRRTPGGLSAPTDSAPIDAISGDVLSCLPVAIRSYVSAGAGDGEHRKATIGFLHFDGIEERIARRGTADVADDLDDLVRTVQAAVDRFEVTFVGTDIDADGGKIILAAGIPRAGDNDEARLVLAAREILDRSPRIPVRIGVNCGRVFAGDVGPSYRRTYTAMGDAVNLAARVMAKARAGELLVADAVLEAARLDVDATAMEPFMVKGKSRPVHASQVRAARPLVVAEAVAVDDVTPIIGREPELGFLLTRLQTAADGRGQVVQIVGEPGIGKSRLVAELRARSPHPVRSVLCEQFEASTPYFAARHLLRTALSIPASATPAAAGATLLEQVTQLAPDLTPWVPLVADVVGADVPSTRQSRELDPQFRRGKVAEVADELLGLAFGTTPSLLVIEDTHWIDEPSAALVRHLIDTSRQRPWMWCLTRRDVSDGLDLADAPQVSVLRPAPLSADHAAVLLDAATETTPLAPHEIELLTARAGGNPLFLRELLATAQETGSVADLPDSVEALMVAHIDRLSIAERAAVRRLAVLGTTFELDLAAAVLDDPTVLSHLSGLLVRDVPGVARFRHALLRDAAYDALPFRLRRELHAHVGEVLEARAREDDKDNAGVLSLHFFNAGCYDKAWAYSVQAARHAASIYANVEAVEHFERALQAARRISVSDVDVASVHETLGDVHRRLGQYSAADASFRAARRLLSEHKALQGRLLVKTSRLQEVSGRHASALRWLRRAALEVDALEGETGAASRAQVAVAFAALRYAQGRPADVIRWCDLAIEQARLGSERDALAHAYYLLDAAHVQLGQLDRAVHSADALALYEELGDLWGQGVVLNNLGGYAYWRGEWDEARVLYERGRDARERIGDIVNASYGTINVAEILSDQGRLDEAEPLLRQVLRVWRAAADRASIAFGLGHLGRVTYRAGRHDEAFTMLEEARKLAANFGRQVDVLELTGRTAECLLFAGDARGASDQLDKAFAQLRTVPGGRVHEAMLRRIRGFSLMMLGDPDGARAEFECSLTAARQRSLRYDVGLALRPLAALASASESADTLRAESLEILNGLGVVQVFEPPAVAGVTEPHFTFVPAQVGDALSTEATT